MDEKNSTTPFRVTWRNSLGTRLVLVSIVILVVALIAVGSGLILIAGKAQREGAYRLQEKSADKVALLISSYVSTALDDLLLFENMEPLATLTPARQRITLENLLIYRQSLYSQFTLLSNDGTENVRVSRFYTYLPGELRRQAHSPAFITAMKGNNYLSPVFVSPDSGLLSVQMAVPVRDRQREIVGVLTAEANVSPLWQEVSRIHTGRTGYAYLVDVKGRFVAYQEPAKVLQRYGEDMRRVPPVAEFMASQDKAVRQVHQYRGLTNEPVLGVYAPIQNTSWAVIVEWPTKEAYASVTRMQRYLLGLMLLGVLVVGVLGLAVSRRLVHPIKALTVSAQRMGAGDLDTEVVEVQGQDEVGVLARAFRNMKDELKVLYREKEEQLAALKRAQDALQRSEEHYRSIFENSPEGIFQTTPGGCLLSVNPTFARMFGYESPQEMTASITNVGHQLYADPGERARLVALLEEQGVVEAFETECQRKDGQRIWISINVRAVRDPKGLLLHYEGTTEDISERKRAEEALRIAHQRLFDIIEFLPDATFVIDHEKKVVAWNRACEEMTGVKKEAILGSGDHAYAVPFYGEKRPVLVDYVAGHTDELMKKYESVRRREDTLYGESFTPGLRDGKGAFLAGIASPLFDKDGNIVGAIESIRDITDVKRLESQLLQSQKMEAIGTLAGGIAHDFNNLLMGIQGYTSLILSDTQTNDAHREMLLNIEKQVASGANLARQLLGFARGGQYEVKPTDLNEIITDTVSTFGRTRKDVVIQTTFEKALWTVEVDRGQIEQVLLNLCINAWEAMPGGGNLTIETRNVHLDEEHGLPQDAKPGKYVKFSVTDTGTGMDEKTKERIFDPFFTTKEMGRGTGLGLASAYGIIKTHGGIIRVDTELGQGTAFSIFLPSSEKEVARERVPAGELEKGGETILLVDDEEMIIDVNKAILETLGYRVLVARNGTEALEIYEKNNEGIALVILDMIMPGLGGGEIFDALKTVNPSVKTILSSGYSMDGRAREILLKGCKGFLQKPFNVTELSRKVREALDA
jgi:two-component system cell cycle sensor histidine kinase/response regulator CckA